MKRASTSSPRSLLLHRKVEIEVTRARFTVLESLRFLDVERLSRAAAARFEVGFFETGCCHRVVHARVRKGMVTGFELERPDKQVKATGEMRRLLVDVQRALGGRPKPKGGLPIPLRGFLAKPLITVDVMFCFQICVFGWCLTCCIDTENPLMNFCDVWSYPVAAPRTSK